jgi:hypothetical protein
MLVRTSQESHNVTNTKRKRDSVCTSQESHNVSTTKWKRDSVRTSQESHNVTNTKRKWDSVRASQESHNVSTTKCNEIQFVPHRNHITSPPQTTSEIHFVPHRNHITSPLRVHHVNVIYKLVTMVYKYNYHNSGHDTSSVFYLRHKFSETWFCVRLQVQPSLWRRNGPDSRFHLKSDTESSLRNVTF